MEAKFSNAKIEAIVPAAGLGLRLKQGIDKPLVRIGKIPIVIRTLKALLKSSLIHSIIVVVEGKKIKEIERLIRRFGSKRVKVVVAGGKTRRDSVRNGLKFVDKTSEFVLIHDGARPFIDKATLLSVVNAACKSGAAIVGVPAKSTLKTIRHRKFPLVEATLRRRDVWEIQTPQVFKREIIIKAYKKFKDTEATDDSSLVEKLGVDVYVVKGSYSNIKITTPEDIMFAEAISKKRRTHD